MPVENPLASRQPKAQSRGRLTGYTGELPEGFERIADLNVFLNVFFWKFQI
jgi:hypothetical protein